MGGALAVCCRRLLSCLVCSFPLVSRSGGVGPLLFSRLFIIVVTIRPMPGIGRLYRVHSKIRVPSLDLGNITEHCLQR